MKEKIYSPIAKIAAFLMCILMFSMAVLSVYNFICKYDDVYSFEGSFYDSETGRYRVRKTANNLYYRCIQDHKTITNLKEFQDYDCLVKDANGVTLFSNTKYKSALDFSGAVFSHIIDTDEGIVMVGMKDLAAAELERDWNNDKDVILRAIFLGGIELIISLAALVFLTWRAGRTAGDGIKLILIDKMFPEITAALFIVIAFLAIAAGVGLADYAIYSSGERMFAAYVAAIVALISSSALIALYLSVVRLIKAGKLLERSFIVRTARTLKKHIASLWKEGVKLFGKDISLVKVYILFVLCALLALIAALLHPLLLIAFTVSVLALSAKRVDAFVKICDGLSEIRKGDLEYKITGCPEGVFSKMADDINSIGDGLSESLKDKLKAERMKSELITNVSHDLKTPLTSIISYAEILGGMELTPEEANDYVTIIAEKGQKLKKITADLFDYSKVRSGNDTIKREKIDFALLVRQSLAETKEISERSDLTFVTQIPEYVFTYGDGNKLSRVLENLIGNALKYSLSGTRVYVELREENGAHFEIKNIANYKMDFDSDEITERFVRGDASRSGDGNGLGLAIAKSYVEAMGGRFEIKTDGDLFKAVIKL